VLSFLGVGSAAAQEEVAEAPGEPSVTLGLDGISARNSEGFGFRLHGLLQTGVRAYFADEDDLGRNQFMVRRARPIIDLYAPANLHARFAFEMPNGFTIFDAWAEWSPSAVFNLRVGLFKTPLGLELAQLPVHRDYLEFSLAGNLISNRDLGLMLHGRLGDGVFTYQVAALNGAADGVGVNTSNLSDAFDTVARVFFRPAAGSEGALSGLGFGGAVLFGVEEGSADSPGLGAYRTAGRRVFFRYSPGVIAEGNRLRVNAELYYYWKNFHVLAEWIRSSQEVSGASGETTVANQAWVAELGYTFGGRSTFAGVVPNSPFSPGDGAWGALQLKARTTMLIVDESAFNGLADPSTSASQATEIGGGLNWWWHTNARWILDISHTSFESFQGPASLPEEWVGSLMLQLHM
ncbi:MAG: hypothetical protein KC561_18760, partial [Myxococcales bacterium]|nr:hypothetical protein [Myxococcales bacterium]